MSVSLPKSGVEALTPPHVSLCGEEAAKEVIKIQWGHGEGPWFNRIAFSPLSVHACEALEGGHISQARKRVLDTKLDPAGTLILDFRASRPVRKKCFCCLNHPISGILLQQPLLTNTNIRRLNDLGL